MKIRNCLYFFIVTAFLFACKTPREENFEVATSGLKYHFHEQFPNNEKPMDGDVIILDMRYETSDGKVLFDSKKTNRAYMRTIKPPTHPGGSIEDALNMMKVGDSASFKINAGDFFKFSLKQNALPANVNNTDDLIFHIRMKEILKKENYSTQLDKLYHSSEAKEMELLESYLKRTNVTSEPTESGLYYIMLEKGTGKKAEKGKIVSVHYTGSLISGKVFDSSIGKNPIEFQLGSRRVIPGWEEGIAMMQEGEKARLIIPSKLAYGERGAGKDILPYSTLVFDVELIQVK
jgi:FKBP-type peptidyl-prolyl cis-trans isomerase FkpA